MTIEKQDLTEYSNNELSLLVFNTEYLYRMRRNVRKLMQEIDEVYLYNDEQLTVLLQDIKEDLGEA